ncbi:MAG: hypothetical protein ACR2PK_03865, partial [Acidimicrobiales bacterium]
TVGEWVTRDTTGIAGLARAGDLWGSTILARDLDGDLLLELVVGAPGAGGLDEPDSGVVVVVVGTSDPTIVQASYVIHQGQKRVKGTREPGDRLGAALG